MVYHVMTQPVDATHQSGIRGEPARLTGLMDKGAYNALANLAHDLRQGRGVVLHQTLL